MITTQPMFDEDLHFYGIDERLFHLTRSKKTNTMTTTAPTLQLTHRHFPDSANDFLTHQFGIEVTRPLRRPRYVGKTVADLIETNALTTVFHLLGWGKTKTAAKSMAISAAHRLQLV